VEAGLVMQAQQLRVVRPLACRASALALVFSAMIGRSTRWPANLAAKKTNWAIPIGPVMIFSRDIMTSRPENGKNKEQMVGTAG
jgi:hypothetical protein